MSRNSHRPRGVGVDTASARAPYGLFEVWIFRVPAHGSVARLLFGGQLNGAVLPVVPKSAADRIVQNESNLDVESSFIRGSEIPRERGARKRGAPMR